METPLKRPLRALALTIGALALIVAAPGLSGAGDAGAPDDAGSGNGEVRAGEADEQQSAEERSAEADAGSENRAPQHEENGENGEQIEGETRTVSAKALSDHDCDDEEWHFVITHEDGVSPASIEVVFDTGDGQRTVTVDRSRVTGQVAHYSYSSLLDATVVSATAELPATWDGQFNLSHGPCSEVGDGDNGDGGDGDNGDGDDGNGNGDDGGDQVIVEDDEQVADDETAPVAEPAPEITDEEDAVLGDEVVRSPAPAPQPTGPVTAPTADEGPEVLGDTVTRTGTLPRTGPDSAIALAPFGGLLLALGYGLTRSARRMRARA